MRIGFYAGGCIPIHARTLDERPLGGTETAIIELAARLSARGHDVTIFTSHKNPPHSTPLYLSSDKIRSAERFDILVLVQQWAPALFSLPAKRLFFWTGDGPEQISNFGIGDRRVIARIEKILAVSAYHADSLCAASGYPRAKVEILGNGVRLSTYQGAESREPKRLIYTSAPYRGLELAVPMFAKLHARHPDATFHVFSGMNLYDRDTPFRGPYIEIEKRVLHALSALDGCVVYGTVTQARLAREYMKSALFFYPATVSETCCITALEAQAAGCALLTSQLGALVETVGGAGETIPGNPHSKEFGDAFVAAADRILSESALWTRYSNAAIARAKDLDWGKVAERFEELSEV